MFQIRRAQPDEAGILTEIAIAAKRYWNYPEHWIRTWIPLLTFKPEDVESGEVYAAVQENEIVGFCRFSIHGARCLLDDLWVRPDAIGGGVGRALFEFASFRGREAGAAILEVDADPNAVGFYEKMGMHKIGEHTSRMDGQLRSLPVLEIHL